MTMILGEPLFLQPIREVLFVNMELGSGCPTSEGPSQLKSVTPEGMAQELLSTVETKTGVITSYAAPKTRGELKGLLARRMHPGMLVISTDNAVSYAILKAFWKAGWIVDADIVLDQHEDIYNHQTHGKFLTKANPYRFALDFGLLERMIFVGQRKLEEAFHNPYLLLPETLLLQRPPTDFLYALMRNYQGQHAGLDEYIDRIPARRVTGLAESLDEALKLLEAHAVAWKISRGYPLATFGFEIDFDVFNSHQIQGVDYGLSLPERLREDARERFQRSRNIIGFLKDLWVTSYVQHKIECPGIPVPSQVEIKAAAQKIKRSPLGCAFAHFTEVKLEFDDKKRSTAELISSFAVSLIGISQETV